MDIAYKTDDASFNYRVAGIWIKDGYVLIHKNIDDQAWALPGGRVMLGEESLHSITREVYEELGVVIKAERLIWIVENFFEYNQNTIHEVGLYYLITPVANQLELNEQEFFGIEGERLIYKWVPIKKLTDIDLFPAFLKTALLDIPKFPKHIITKQA